MAKWYRVDNHTEGIAVLIEAEDAESATRQYMEEYPPDLYVYEAGDWDIEQWENSVRVSGVGGGWII